MELIFLLVGVAIGAVGGFLVSKKLSASEQDYQRLEQEVNESKTSLANYQQEVASHLNNSAQLLAQMNDTCKSAMQQMAESTTLLNKATLEPNAMPFFSPETEAQLLATTEVKKPAKLRKEQALTEAPRDYSNEASGLFNDKKQVVTNSAS